VTSRQSVTMSYPMSENAERAIAFRTGPDNEGNVMVYDRPVEDLVIEITVPKASGGSLQTVENDTKTKIQNDQESDGSLRVVPTKKGVQKEGKDVVPSVFVYVIHATGEIEIEYVEINFEVLRRDIGLTTEFKTLAVSNFTGVEEPDPRSKSSGSGEQREEPTEEPGEGEYEYPNES
jgi:hypothetical protein